MSIGSIITGVVLFGIIAAIVVRLFRKKKNGKCAGCSCGCGN